MVRAALVVLLALLSAAPAVAQKMWVNPYTGGMWNNPGSCLLDTMIRNQMNRRMMEKSMGRQAPTQGTSPRPTPTTTRVERLTYKGSSDLGNADRLAASITDNPKDRRELASSFREALQSYRKAAAQVGRGNDVGYALTLCVLTTYCAANGCEFSQAQQRAVLRQMDEALADMPALRRASDAERQSMAETFVMIALFIAAGYDQSGKDAQARAAFVQLAEVSFKNLTGLDANSVTLTDAGLRSR